MSKVASGLVLSAIIIISTVTSCFGRNCFLWPRSTLMILMASGNRTEDTPNRRLTILCRVCVSTDVEDRMYPPWLWLIHLPILLTASFQTTSKGPYILSSNFRHQWFGLIFFQLRFTNSPTVNGSIEFHFVSQYLFMLSMESSSWWSRFSGTDCIYWPYNSEARFLNCISVSQLVRSWNPFFV